MYNKIKKGKYNIEKRKEVQNFLNYNKCDIKLITLQDIGFNEEIEENGETFEENSLIKAKAVKEFCIKNNINKIVIADDAGLVVDALGGRPGVHSARYAGDHASQEVVLNKLLNEMKDFKGDERKASFVCVLTVAFQDGRYESFKGVTEGKIAEQCGKMGGLTFCPVFMPNGYDRVMNDLTQEEMGHTHREKAWKDLLKNWL